MAVLRYLPKNGLLTSRQVLFEGRDLFTMTAPSCALSGATASRWSTRTGSASTRPSASASRWRKSSATTAPCPPRRIQAALECCARSALPNPPRRGPLPYQLSGGMQQRVVIAMALASDPALLVLDEPTTALDATVQADILDLFQDLRGELKAAILFISHNLAVVQQVCDRIGVMYAGELIEQGTVAEVFSAPATLHRSIVRLHPRLRRPQAGPPSGRHHRRRPRLGRPRHRLPVRTALRDLPHPVPGRTPGPAPRRQPPPEPLLLPHRNPVPRQRRHPPPALHRVPQQPAPAAPQPQQGQPALRRAISSTTSTWRSHPAKPSASSANPAAANRPSPKSSPASSRPAPEPWR